MKKSTAYKWVVIGMTVCLFMVKGSWGAHLSIDGPAKMDSIHIAEKDGVILGDANCLVVGEGGILNLGTLTAVQGNILSEGNFLNGGSFVPGTSEVLFNGNGLQRITGNNTFYLLSIYNSYAGAEPDDNDVRAEALTVSKALTVQKGQFQPADESQFGDVAIENEGALKPAAGASIGVDGDWSNEGAFVHNAGSVILNGTGQFISGITTFYDLTKIVNTADTLTFAAGSDTTIANTMTLQGEKGALLSLRSATPETRWNINPQGDRNVSYLDVEDSNNINEVAIDARYSYCLDSGNNINWLFKVDLTMAVSPASKGFTTPAAGAAIAVYANVAQDISADPSSGWYFVGWTATPAENAAFGNSLHSVTTVTLTGSATVTAHFVINTYVLNTAVNPVAGGNVARNPDKLNYDYGEKVQLTAAANEKYTFTGWSGDLKGTDNPATITMVGSKSVTAHFASAYSVTYNGNGNTGGAPPVDGKTYQKGAEVTVLGANTLVKSGYSFNAWNTAADGGGTQYAPGARFNMPEADVTLYAQWIAGKFRLTVNNGTGSGEYKAGHVVSIAATPAQEGKVFDVWTGDVSYVANVNLANTHVTMPEKGITVTATYKDKPAEKFTLTVNNGTGSGQYETGEVVGISAADAPEGKIFDVWTGDTANVKNIEESNTTITIPSAHVSVTAIYKDIPDEKFTLTVTSGTGSGQYKAGDSVNIAASPNSADQIFDVWMGDTASVANINNANTTLKMPDGDISVTATYKDKPAEEFTLTVTSGTGSGQYKAGIVVGIAASVPDEGMIFDIWAGQTGTVANINDPNTTLTMPNAGAAISATYKEQPVEKFPLTINSGTGSGSYPAGQVVSINADPAPAGHIFDKWAGQTGTVVNVNNANTSITMPESPVVIKAVYKAEPAIKYTLDVNSGTGGGEYKAGRVVTIAATPAETGFIFDKWAGQTANVANVNIPNTTITMPESDVGVTATYKTDPDKDFSLEIRTDTWEQMDADMTVAWKRSAVEQVPAGRLVNLNAPDPPGGYVFDIWAGQTGNVANVNLPNTTLYMPDSDVTVIAAYKPQVNPVSLTVTSGTGSGEYDPNTVVGITADDPPAGQMFDKWTGQTGAVENINLADTCIVMPSTDVNIGAAYRDKPVDLYALSVADGTGSGEYAAAEMVAISANAAPEGLVFDKWVGQIATVENINSADTRLYMPPNTVAVTAAYTGASAATQVDLTGPAAVHEGEVSTVFTLTSQDADGNAANVAGDTTFALTSDSTGNAGFYSDADGMTAIAQVTILAGTSQAAFYYKDTAPGVPTITAARISGMELGDATHQLEVIGGLSTVTTQAVTEIGPTTATGNGTITDLGSEAPSQHGVCWNTTGSPTLEDPHTEEGPVAQTGSFTGALTSLTAGMTYYVRAYAASSLGTAYGEDVTFAADYTGYVYVSADGLCGGKNPCYKTIQDALDGAWPGNAVRIAKGIYKESITLNSEKILVLQGGWDGGFSTQSPDSTFIRTPLVLKGALLLEMITIVSPESLYVSQDGICGGNIPCFTTIQDAVNAAGSGDAIRIAQGTYNGSIVLNSRKDLLLQGGWDSAFTAQTPDTTFIRKPDVHLGSLALQMVTIVSSGFCYVNPTGTCGNAAPCYSSIQDAVDASVSGDIICIAGGTYTECIIMDAPRSLTFSGGWDAVFTSQTAGVTFIKPPVVLNGQLSLQMLSVTGAVSLYVSRDGICGERTPCYSDIQVAVDAACSGDAIQIAQGTYAENIIFSAPFGLTLEGGWNDSYTAQTANTSFIRTPVVQRGKITLKMLSIRP